VGWAAIAALSALPHKNRVCDRGAAVHLHQHPRWQFGDIASGAQSSPDGVTILLLALAAGYEYRVARATNDMRSPSRGRSQTDHPRSVARSRRGSSATGCTGGTCQSDRLTAFPSIRSRT